MRIDACTYELGSSYYVEKMQDGTWTAYRVAAHAHDRCQWEWHSPKHRSRKSAVAAASAERRRRRWE